MEDEGLPLHRMRASDAERDLTVDRLTTAFVEGRLDHEEYDRRVGLALGAVLLGELRPLTEDLPVSTSAVRGVPGARHGTDPLSDPLSGAARTDPGSGRGPRDGREPPDADDLSLLGAPWREWGDEWRWWTGVAVILTSVWGVVSLMGGELVPYWPLVPLGIWAAVLLASAIWPSEGEPP